MRKILSIQYLRAFAALGVVTLHFALTVGNWFPVGTFGVDIFFVISGFIIWVATATEAKRDVRIFATDRVSRILPTYWIITLLTVAGAAYRPWVFATGAPTLAHTVISLLFVPTESPVVAQGWTLNIEIYFYAIFAATLFLRRGIQIVVLTVLLAGLALAGVLGAAHGSVATAYLNPRLCEFVTGLWIGEYWLRGRWLGGRIGIALVVVGLAASQAILWLRPEHIVLVGTWIVTSAMVVGGALSCEGQFEIVEIPMLVMTGDASYLIYLIHNPVLSFFRLQVWLWWPLQLAGALAACVCAAVGLLPVERFVVRFVRVRLRGWLEAARGVAAGGSLAVIDHPAGGDGR